MSTPLPAVPSFIERDPEVIRAALVARFEEATGRILQPAQVEALLIEVFAYAESLVRIAIQDVAVQNLVAFARYPNLDFLGELVGAERLPAAAATTTVRFTLVGVQDRTITVPAGTRVQTTDGLVIFTTDKVLEIAPGAGFGDVGATADAVGAGGNGYAAGSVSTLLDPISLVASAANTTATAGGTQIEDDESYRARIRQAPEQFSVAGSVGAYRYHTLSVSPSIVDVTVANPLPGVVRLYVLTDSGLPGADLLMDVFTALSAETVRPLSDTVEVVAPAEVPYQIEATVRLLTGADAEATLAEVEEAASSYAADRRAGLGRDIVPSQVVAALSVPGVYEVTLTQPAARVVLTEAEWANCTAITIAEGARADG